MHLIVVTCIHDLEDNATIWSTNGNSESSLI